MKKTILLLAAICSYNCSTAQSLDPQVISSSGTSFNNGSSQIDFTMGEPTTATLNGSGNELTQGFHQPELLVTSIDNVENTDFSVFPNPTISYVQVVFAKQKEDVLIELYTMEGKLLQNKRMINAKELQIDMSSYTTGQYLLSIKDNNNKTFTYKVSKTN